MRPARVIPFFFLLAFVQPARSAVFEVGPGQPYATPSDVPWESTVAGDSVRIHARPTPYRDKWVICRVGTQSAPIVVHGIPDASGNLPIIEGANALTRSALNFWNEERGVIKIGGANSPPDAMPAWVVIENLEIRGARPENIFTGRSGVTSYAGNASSIYIEKGQHVVVRGCHLHDCSNGFFCASQTSDLLVEANWIEDNGNVGSIFEHNNYTEAAGITFQFNHFGPLRSGAGGNNLKDRSAGCVVRYNWIEGGNRQLDLVESDFDALINDPRYHTTFVYGNVLLERGDDGNSQIVHYGGDGGQTAKYRKGTLYFHHNTVVSRRTGNTTLFRLSSDGESADARNNLVYVTAAGNRLALLDQTGSLTLTRNWLNTGWVESHSGGNPNITDNGEITGTAPGFLNQAADNFELAQASACVDTCVALLPPVVPDHVPVFEYVKHQVSRPRVSDGEPDLGAYEFVSSVGVTPGVETGPRLVVTPNPFVGSCEIRLEGSMSEGGVLEALDVAGRRVARIASVVPGRWTWKPAPSLREGVYYLRLGSLEKRVVFVR